MRIKMPTYNFEDENGDIRTFVMLIRELDEFKKMNPHLKQVILKAPKTIGSHNLKPDDDFRNRLNQIKSETGTNIETF